MKNILLNKIIINILLIFYVFMSFLFAEQETTKEIQSNIDSLMLRHNYTRIFNKLTFMDAWYVRNDVLKSIL